MLSFPAVPETSYGKIFELEARMLKDCVSSCHGNLVGIGCVMLSLRKLRDTIEIRGSGSNFVSVKLVNGKAIVSYKGKQWAELPVSKYFFKLVVRQPRHLNEEYIKQFVKTHRGVIRQLIFSIVSDESIEPETIKVLVGDKTFLKAVQDTRNQFEKRSSIFLKAN